MSLSEQDLDNIIFQMESEVNGEASAIDKLKSFTDPIWEAVLDAGYAGDIAHQIVERYYKHDYDYTTVQGAVISNVFFQIEGLQWSEDQRPSDIGAKDLQIAQLGKLEGAKYRPKLPGKMMTKKQVQEKGRRTCYDLVERVGDTLYGIFPYKKLCDCCRTYEWRSKRDVQLESWHEGYMVLLNNIEYRVKRNPTIDRVHEGFVWEMERVRGEWKPKRPREYGKHMQREAIADSQALVSMLEPDSGKKVPGKRQMSKILVLGQRGPYLVNQLGVWDLVGGKQDIEDSTPLAIAQREYLEETGLHAPPLTKIGMYETSVFTITLFYTKDERLEGGHNPSLLVSPQRETWDECFSQFDPELMSELKSADYYRWLYQESSTVKADRERELLMNRISRKPMIWSALDLPFKVDHFLSDGRRAYICNYICYEKLSTMNNDKEIAEFLTESFSLQYKYGIRVGSSFFAVKPKEDEARMLVYAYISRYDMEKKEDGKWIVAWSRTRLGEKRKIRYEVRPKDLWNPVYVSLGIQDQYGTDEQDEIDATSSFVQQVRSFDLLPRGQIYTSDQIWHNISTFGMREMRVDPIRDLLGAQFLKDLGEGRYEALG